MIKFIQVGSDVINVENVIYFTKSGNDLIVNAVETHVFTVAGAFITDPDFVLQQIVDYLASEETSVKVLKNASDFFGIVVGVFGSSVSSAGGPVLTVATNMRTLHVPKVSLKMGGVFYPCSIDFIDEESLQYTTPAIPAGAADLYVYDDEVQVWFAAGAINVV